MVLLLQTLALAITNVRTRWMEWRQRPRYDYVDHVVEKVRDLQ